MGHPTPAPGRVALRRAVGLGLTGAVVAAVIAVATLVPGVDTSPGAGGSPATDGSARDVLLAAAVRAESAPTRGTYWHVRSTSTTTWPRSSVAATTATRSSCGRSRSYGPTAAARPGGVQRRWVRPKSSEDEAAWRRDGSPNRWCMGNTDTEPPQPNCLHTAPGTASLSAGQDTFVVVEGRELTFEQLQRLPDDPQALRDWVVDASEDDLDPSVSAEIIDLNVAEVLANLLVDVPVPPGVRAAAYRALAGMPNVRSSGPTRDELGRCRRWHPDRRRRRGHPVCRARRRLVQGGETHSQADHRPGHLPRAGQRGKCRRKLRSG